MSLQQRQYFEQKKRQQQQTSGFNNNVDVNICGQYPEKPKSLDILSFLNLETVAQESKSSLINEKSVEVDRSPVKCHFSNCSPASLVTRIIPKYAAAPEEAIIAENNSTDNELECVSLKPVISNSPVNLPSSRNHLFNTNVDALDGQKTESEHKLSVLDLLGDDGPSENSEGSPVHEAHVAFSVEGLGKMGMGTPLHSPQRSGRVFSNGFSSPKPVRQHQSLKNLNYMNDLELELNSMIQDVDMSSCGNCSELPINTRDTKRFSIRSQSKRLIMEGCMPLNAHVCQRADFLREEKRTLINTENESIWQAGPGFLDENFSDDRIHDAVWKNQAYNMDNNFTDFLRNETDDVSDFTFEDSSLTHRRNVAKSLRDFNSLGSSSTHNDSPVSYLNHLLPEKDHDFKYLNKRNPVENESWNFGPPTWSSFAAEDAKDNMSLLSEESSSSSAVKGGKAKYSTTNSILGKSPRKHGSEFSRKNVKAYSRKDIFAEEVVYNDGNRKDPGNNFKVSGSHKKMINPSRSKVCNQSNDPHCFEKDSDPQHSWFLEEGFTTDLPSPNFFQRTSVESDLTSLECQYWSEDLFGLSPCSDFYLNKHSYCKKTKLDAPSFSIFSERTVSPQRFSSVQCYDSPSFLSIASKSRKPDITQVSRMQAEPQHSYHAKSSQGDVESPSLSDKGEIPEDGEHESECQPSSPKELEKESSVGNNGFSSENGKTLEAPCLKNSSQAIEAETKNSEHSDLPITGHCPEHAEEIPSAEKVPDKFERCQNDNKFQFDGHWHFPNNICNEGYVKKEHLGPETTNTQNQRDHIKNPSYQVMLESYVLQLLCVQKVLREATEEDSAK